MRLFVLPLVALALSACAPTLQTHQVSRTAMEAEAMNQLTFALEEEHKNNRRVFGIALRVLSASAPLCGSRVAHDYTLFSWNRYIYDDGLKREAATRLFKLGEQPSVRLVFDGSPAAQAGLREGDILVKVGTHTVGSGGKRSVSDLHDYLRKLEKQPAPTPLDVVFARGDELKTTTIRPAPVCNYGFSINPANTINAYADGDNIVMYQGIIDLARSDDEIALVVGHELAHNVLNHVQKKQGNVLLGGLGGLLLDAALGTGGQFSRAGQQIGMMAYSPAFESEADYFGLYSVALAGYDYSAAPQFWRRMGARSQDSITLTTTHPATAERFVALERTVREIQGKIDRREKLEPNKKK
jgi:Zn-dependent protease with chaperone function